MPMRSEKIIKKILFIIPTQYGYHTDSYQYCENLSMWYDVTYLGIELGKKKRKSSKVHIHSIKARDSLLWRYSLLKSAYRLEKKFHYDVIFIESFPLCSLFQSIFPKSLLIMDIRTSVIRGKYKSFFLNHLIKLESLFFKRISVISEGVIEFLQLNRKKCRILPLGGAKYPFMEKNFNKISLLYVGTFYDRHIETTIDGFATFIQKHPEIDISYTIIGTGSNADKSKIMDKIIKYKSDKILFVGEKRHEELLPYLSACNVGISYIPLTDYYDCQPPTKTYEYLLSSMVVIATPTSENKKVINTTNGILLQSDSAADFARGIETLIQVRQTFDFNYIYDNAQIYTWEHIVKHYLIPIVSTQ